MERFSLVKLFKDEGLDLRVFDNFNTFDFKSLISNEELTRLNPFDLYRSIYNTLPERIVYISTPLTSAGYMELPIGKRILANGEMAQMVFGSDPDRCFNNSGVVFPHHIGTREDWQETDYLIFWTQFLANLNPDSDEYKDSVDRTQRWLEENTDLVVKINNKDGEREERIEAYNKLASVLVKFWAKPHLDLSGRKVQKVFFVGDWNQSLGCSVEHKIVKGLGIETEYLEIPKYLQNPGPPSYVFANHISNERRRVSL